MSEIELRATKELARIKETLKHLREAGVSENTITRYEAYEQRLTDIVYGDEFP